MSVEAAEAPRRSAGVAPLRRPGSIRRTSSIDVSWPEGRDGQLRFDGRARDIATAAQGGDFRVLAEDAYVATLDTDRTIVAIEAEPPRAATARLAGERGGGHLRDVLRTVMPEEIANGSPLYLVLDDISGTSLIAGWAWSQWDPAWMEQYKGNTEERVRRMEGVCIGFRPGSSALDPGRVVQLQDDQPTLAPDLRHPEDPDGWHAFTAQPHAGMRRARRIDVWRDVEGIHIDAAFQDSASTPTGDRAVLHEYQLAASVDPVTLNLTALEALPRVLPFPECTAAPDHMHKLLQTPVGRLRERVLDSLPGTAGCTHLNDALRAMAEVPVLVAYLND